MTRLLPWFRLAFDGLGTDLRLGVRRLLRTRGFTVVALGSLALGIGANTALFSIVYALFFRPVPGVTNPDRVVELLAVVRGRTLPEWTYPDLDDVRAADTPLETIAGWKTADGTLAIDDAVQGVRVMYVSSGYFPVLGVNLALGRRFQPSEDVGPGQHPIAIISHDLWQTSLGGRVDAVGQVVTLNRMAYTVVGVTPEAFRHHRPASPAIDLWAPLTQHPVFTGPENWVSSRSARWVEVLGRLRPGARVSDTNAALATVFRRLAAQYPATNRDRGAVAAAFGPFPANNRLADTLAMLSLLAFGALVLLIICANLAGMVLARGVAEEHDLAIRVALGGGRARLVRATLVDAGVLAVAGGVLGSVAAWWGTSVVGARLVGVPHMDLAPGAPVLAFSFLLVLATALAVGLLPALRLTGADLIGSLKDETRGGGRRPGRLHRWAVAAQVGVAVLCITVSTVFVQSLSQLDRRDLGFDPDRLLVVSLDLSTQGYDDAARGLRFADRVLETVRALPGVAAAAVADGLPVDLVGNFTRASRADRPSTDPGVQAEFTRVGAGFFQAVGTRVLRGRGIETSDTPASPRVVVIGRRLAERLWPGEDVLGRQVQLSFDEKGPVSYTVVGVTPDVAASRPGEDWPQLFVALAQHYGRPRFHLLVRGRTEAAALTRSVQSAIRSVDPLFATSSAVTSRDLLARALDAQRVTALSSGGIGAAGLFLSAFGLYGLVAFVVAQRMREFGIRMALGATREQILRATLGEGVRLAAPGLAVGALAAASMTFAMQSMLMGVAPLSPVAFGLTGLLVLAVVLLACTVPAARAAGADPAAALRAQ